MGYLAILVYARENLMGRNKVWVILKKKQGRNKPPPETVPCTFFGYF